MIIKLLEGFDNLNFGATRAEFLDKFPKSTDFEILEEEGELKTEGVLIEDLMNTLYFEGDETEMLFTACDTGNKDALLFGEKIFTKTEKEIIDIMAKHNYTDYESEIEEWGEKNVSFIDAMADFYFSEGKLTSVSWGILIL
jgi:hypothetical protein